VRQWLYDLAQHRLRFALWLGLVFMIACAAVAGLVVILAALSPEAVTVFGMPLSLTLMPILIFVIQLGQTLLAVSFFAAVVRMMRSTLDLLGAVKEWADFSRRQQEHVAAAVVEAKDLQVETKVALQEVRQAVADSGAGESKG
jgi:hypothetical protein